MEISKGDGQNKNSAESPAGDANNPPILAENYGQVERELREIQALIPMRGAPREERAARNQKIREMLPNLSNYTVIMLAIGHGHQLSLKEFKKRLAENVFTSLKELFLIRSYVGDGIDFRYGGSLHAELRRKIMESVPAAGQNEIVDIFCYYLGDSIMNKGNIMTDVLLERADAEEIIRRVRETGGKGSGGSNINQALHFVESDYRKKSGTNIA